MFDPDGTPYVNYANKTRTPGKGYRYPSPASRGQVEIPSVENLDQVYDIQYYTRDARRNNRPAAQVLSEQLVALPVQEEPTSSPGNNVSVRTQDFPC